jgi:hypothetical protein
MAPGDDAVPGMWCLPMGLKGVVVLSGKDSRLRSWVPNNGNMERPGFLPTLTSLASRVRQSVQKGRYIWPKSEVTTRN